MRIRSEWIRRVVYVCRASVYVSVPLPFPVAAMSPWYVWLVGKYTEEVPCGLIIVGIFTSHDKAKEAAYQGCWISVVPVDEVGQVQLEAEWIA